MVSAFPAKFKIDQLECSETGSRLNSDKVLFIPGSTPKQQLARLQDWRLSAKSRGAGRFVGPDVRYICRITTVQDSSVHGESFLVKRRDTVRIVGRP